MNHAHIEGEPKRNVRRRVDLSRLALVLLLLGAFSLGAVATEVTDFGAVNASNSISDQPDFSTLQTVWDLIHDEFDDHAAIDDQK